jgi:amidohydrolase
MRHSAMFLLAGITCFSAGVSAESATQSAQGVLKDETAWRRDFHEHPELSNRETRTAGIIAAELKKLGYEVRTGIAHTGVTGVLKGGKPGPKLAIRSDIDALPVTEQVDLPFASKAKSEYLGKPVGVMHACGHDAHMAMLLGLAEIFAGMKKDLPGEIMLIFQPAEEGAPPGEPGGASLMVADGVFRDFKPDAVFGMHVVSSLNAGTVGVRAGGAMASSDTFRITIHGRQSHGATPWKGIDPIVTAAEIVTSAQTIVSRQLDISKEPAVVTFGTFNGGQRFNIVPESAELAGTIRTFDEGMRAQIKATCTCPRPMPTAIRSTTTILRSPRACARASRPRSARSMSSSPRAGRPPKTSRTSASARRRRRYTFSSARRRRARTPPRRRRTTRRNSSSTKARSRLAPRRCCRRASTFSVTRTSRRRQATRISTCCARYSRADPFALVYSCRCSRVGSIAPIFLATISRAAAACRFRQAAALHVRSRSMRPPRVRCRC